MIDMTPDVEIVPKGVPADATMSDLLTATESVGLMSADELLERITKEVWSLAYDLRQFRFAFSEEPTRIDVMNAIAPRFFLRWQLLIYDRILLGVARLFDPAKRNNQKNVSWYALLEANRWNEASPEKHGRMESLIESARATCAGCIKHRHKRISHWDQLAAANLHVLPKANLKLVSESIGHLERLLQAFYEAMERGSVSFELISLDIDDTKRLFAYLMNRRSQRRPDQRAEIHYQTGVRDADLVCPFCGEQETIAFYPRGVPSPAQMSRWHYDRCDGVIGCETILVDLIDDTRPHSQGSTSTIEIDLRRPTRETE